jgi:leucyl aminopeptidase
MNKAEEYVRQKLIEKGWVVLKRGYPDFFCYKEKGKFVEILFVEVKYNKHKLSLEQKQVIRILEKSKLGFKMVRVTNYDINNIEKKCECCGLAITIPSKTKDFKYCEECKTKMQLKQKRDYDKKKNRNKSFNKINNNRINRNNKEIQNNLREFWIIEKKCNNCNSEINNNIIYDEFHGDAICKRCGNIIGWLQIG